MEHQLFGMFKGIIEKGNEAILGNTEVNNWNIFFLLQEFSL